MSPNVTSATARGLFLLVSIICQLSVADWMSFNTVDKPKKDVADKAFWNPEFMFQFLCWCTNHYKGLHARYFIPISNILFRYLVFPFPSYLSLLSWSYIGWYMVGKHDEKLDSGISSLAKCGGCKATGRIVIGSKSDIIIVNTEYGICFAISMSE